MNPNLDQRIWNKPITNIVLWNITPYIGVWLFHWNPLTVFVCYALETIVIGVFNVFKLIAVYFYGLPNEVPEGIAEMGFFGIPAFALSYGFLIYFQLCFFFFITGYVKPYKGGGLNSLSYSMNLFMDDKTTYLALSAFIVSSAYSFVNDFILPQEYSKRTMTSQVGEPFPRIIVSQLVVFGGVTFYLMTRKSIVLLITFTAIKIAVEILWYRKVIAKASVA